MRAALGYDRSYTNEMMGAEMPNPGDAGFTETDEIPAINFSDTGDRFTSMIEFMDGHELSHVLDWEHRYIRTRDDNHIQAHIVIDTRNEHVLGVFI